jgi:hypothetical protein
MTDATSPTRSSPSSSGEPQVFRRVDSDWQLVHRHADPLVHAIDLEQAAALARG